MFKSVLNLRLNLYLFISVYKIFLSQIKINGLIIFFDLIDLKKISKKILFFSPGIINIGLEFTYFTI